MDQQKQTKKGLKLGRCTQTQRWRQ